MNHYPWFIDCAINLVIKLFLDTCVTSIFPTKSYANLCYTQFFFILICKRTVLRIHWISKCHYFLIHIKYSFPKILSYLTRKVNEVSMKILTSSAITLCACILYMYFSLLKRQTIRFLAPKFHIGAILLINSNPDNSPF